MSGAPNTSTPTPTVLAGHRQRRVKVTALDGSWVEYIGYASPNTDPSAVGWQILRNSYDTTGEFIQLDYADGSDGFTFIWDNYLTYTYD